jgi:two-component system chemotaxis response regulator CheY
MAAKRILSVGQCGADHGSLSRTFKSHFGAEITRADGAAEALGLMEQQAFDLVLVNRVFDADGASGLDFIRQLMQREPRAIVPVMLVSNYDDAQREAVAAGASPGFGKASLGQPSMLARVHEALESGKEN